MNLSTVRSGSNWSNKVPEATLIFWIIKMMSTTVGETAADYLNINLHLGLSATSLITALALVVALVFQMRAKCYIPYRYWTTVVFISVFGTLITDNLSDNLGVPLVVSTAFFGLMLALTFLLWFAREKTLSIHTIDSPKRETYYWVAILFTFALGTAAGDLLAESLNLGYAYSALVFGGLIALTAFSYYGLKANAVACFWIAYVLTRPLGASCGDLLSQSKADGGFALGTNSTSLVFLLLIIGFVLFLTVSQKKRQVSAKESSI